MGFCGGGEGFLLGGFVGEGERLSFFTLAFLPRDEKNPPADLLADNGNGIGKDLIVGVGDVSVEFCVELLVIGARDG